jgi:formylglycine-generating enzyme required for sulfatase activity
MLQAHWPSRRHQTRMNATPRIRPLTAGFAIGLLLTVCQASTPVPCRITAVQDEKNIILTWDTVPGAVYQIYGAPALDGDWAQVEVPVVALSTRTSLGLDITAASQLYRVAAILPEGASGMAWIPPGTFTSGSSPDELDRDADEGPQTEIILTIGYWMGRHLVTQAEYQSLMGHNPSFFNGVRNWPEPGTDYGVDLSRPVEQVSWEDAALYCAALTEQERTAGRIPSDMAYRLPTEAEWEYASRAGTTTRFWYGDDPDYSLLAYHAWYLDNSDQRTHPVGQKTPNPWGLFDIYGNVWQWCQDWYGTYPGGTVTDPQGPTTGTLHVLRGGSWASGPEWCRSANRDTPRGRPSDFGFRVVLAPVR